MTVEGQLCSVPDYHIGDDMKPLLTRNQVQILLNSGHTQADIASMAGISERTVRRISREPKVRDVDDKVERSNRRIGRPSKTDPFRKFVLDTLEKEPDLLSVELLRRAREQGFDGGKSAFFDMVASIRPKEIQYTMRFEGLPGEFSQHDFGEVNITFMDGTRKKIHFFASRLKYSRWVEVSIVPNQQAETLVRHLADHFVSFGGMPLMAVFDRPKTIALKWNRAGEVTDWNPTFAYAAIEMGFGVELCWPYRPNEKGSVENLVGWVKGSFFKQRRFHDEADLLAQLSEWLEHVNKERPCRATGEIPSVRREVELPRLRPLKVQPQDLALRFPVYVGPTAVVRFKGHSYSMPPEAACIPGTLYLYRDKVRIVASRHEATHPRYPTGAVSTLPAHRSARLAAVSGKRGKRYLKRQDLLDTGDAAAVFLTELIHRDSRGWIHVVDRLHNLLQRHGSDMMNLAFREAIADNLFTGDAVARYLGAYSSVNQTFLEVET